MKIHTIVLVIFLSFTAVGCGDKLSKEEITTIIQKQYNADCVRGETFKFPVYLETTKDNEKYASLVTLGLLKKETRNITKSEYDLKTKGVSVSLFGEGNATFDVNIYTPAVNEKNYWRKGSSNSPLSILSYRKNVDRRDLCIGDYVISEIISFTEPSSSSVQMTKVKYKLSTNGYSWTNNIDLSLFPSIERKLHNDEIKETFLVKTNNGWEIDE